MLAPAQFQVPVCLVAIDLGDQVHLLRLEELAIIFCCPRTGAPGRSFQMNRMYFWRARLFTRDAMIKLHKLGVNAIFGVPTQDNPYQQEVRATCISRTSYYQT